MTSISRSPAACYLVSVAVLSILVHTADIQFCGESLASVTALRPEMEFFQTARVRNGILLPQLLSRLTFVMFTKF